MKIISSLKCLTPVFVLIQIFWMDISYMLLPIIFVNVAISPSMFNNCFINVAMHTFRTQV